MANPQRSMDMETRASDRRSERTTERRLERPSRSRLTQDGKFSLDMNRVPSGFVMEWKRHTLMGQEDRYNQVVVQQNHWTPVLNEMQPHILGQFGKEGEHIVVAGLGLYMRPKYLNEDAQKEHQEETDFLTREQLNSLRLSSKEQVGERFTKIKQAIMPGQPVE